MGKDSLLAKKKKKIPLLSRLSQVGACLGPNSICVLKGFLEDRTNDGGIHTHPACSYLVSVT